MNTEAKIIRYLQDAFTAQASSVIGIGDDAACIPKDPDTSSVISKDLFIEDVHFRRRYFSPADIAHKALQSNLSDIAAMGARALYVLLAIALPRDMDSQWSADFFQSFSRACQQAGLILIGGDTCESKAGIFLSITIIGEAANAHLKLRSGAKVGDVVCVVGRLGEAHAGLQALEQRLIGLDIVKHHFLQPQAKVLEGQWLGTQVDVTAMMDISDGLYIDLTRLCQCSQTGAQIFLESLPRSAVLIDACQILNADPEQYQLIGGEDYGLLLTVTQAALPAIQHAFRQQFGYALAVIGTITADPTVSLIRNGAIVPFIYQPFSHFGEKL